MKAIVVLGMHRSGTSLVANILHELGVFLGEKLDGANPWNEWGQWEDHDFVSMNHHILKVSDTNWATPPPKEIITASADMVVADILDLVGWKQGRDLPLWGWKDPRTCLMAHIYHPMLINPYYIQVTRKTGDVIKSLMRRAVEAAQIARGMIVAGLIVPEATEEMLEATWSQDQWKKLIHRYIDDTTTFLSSVDSPRIKVRYEDLMDRRKSKREVERIAEFVGSDKVDKALEAIRYKDA